MCCPHNETAVTLGVSRETIGDGPYFMVEASIEGSTVKVLARGEGKAKAFAISDLGRQ